MWKLCSFQLRLRRELLRLGSAVRVVAVRVTRVARLLRLRQARRGQAVGVRVRVEVLPRLLRLGLRPGRLQRVQLLPQETALLACRVLSTPVLPLGSWHCQCFCCEAIIVPSKV